MCKMSQKSPICTFFTHSASYFRAKFKVKEVEIGVVGEGLRTSSRLGFAKTDRVIIGSCSFSGVVC